MKINGKFFLIFLIFFIALFLRFYKLGEVPASVNADEAAIGYNAYSILKIGRDEYGEKLPLSFRSFDDYKAPLYIYLTSISIALFGLNNFSVRIISALAGSLTVLLTYVMVQKMLLLKDSKIIPLLSALFLAISPWHLQFSRSAYEANVSVFFIVLGVVLFYKGLRTRLPLVFSGISFVLSMWTYHTSRFFVPLLVCGLVILYRKEIVQRKTDTIIAFIVSIVILLPLIFVLLSPTGLVRARGISSLENPDILKQSVRWISDDRGGLYANIFHNRRFEYTREIVKGYLMHFDPAFLFLDRAQSKYRAPGVGLLYLWELPLMIIGLYDIARRGKRWSALLFLWVFLAPIAAAPTLWLPHPVRTIVFLPVLQIITAFGVSCVIRWLHQRRSSALFGGIGFIGLVICTSFIYYIHQYYVHMHIDNASDWQFGRQQVVEEVRKRESAYDRVVVSPSLDQPQIFFLYYLAYDPALYLSEGGTISGKFDTQKNHFAKYYFKSVAGDTSYVNQKSLYVSTPTEMPLQATQLADIQYPDGSIAFVLYEK